MNLLIVDDEPYIVDWIYELLGKELPQLSLFKAYGGVQAVHFLERMEIDILMTDIRMPKMTGLHLMELVRQRWPECKILFLTGFGEFDYVYAAIQQKGVRYLLKTEDDAVIVSTVREMVREVLQEKQSQGDLGYIDRLLRRERALNALLRHAPVDDEMLAALGFHPERPVRFFYVRIHEAAVELSEMDAGEIASKALSDCSHPVRLVLENGDAVWMAQSDRDTDLIAAQAQRFCDALEKAIGGRVEVALMADASPVSEMGGALEGWIGLCAGRAFLQGVSVVTSDAFGEGEPPKRSKLELQRRMLAVKSMEFMLERGERTAYFQTFDEAVEGLLTETHPADVCCTQIYLALALQLMTHIERHSLAPVLDGRTKLTSLHSPDDFASWDAAFGYARRAAEAVFEAGMPERKESAGMAQRLTEYIEGHLDEPLSLTQLAEMLHYNPSYLSRAFKRQMGMNLNAYIAQARIRRACGLLLESGERISEIARRVGFQDARHFTDVFRRNLGVSPQAYRDTKRK